MNLYISTLSTMVFNLTSPIRCFMTEYGQKISHYINDMYKLLFIYNTLVTDIHLHIGIYYMSREVYCRHDN